MGPILHLYEEDEQHPIQRIHDNCYRWSLVNYSRSVLNLD